MELEKTDHEQVETLRKWWQENWLSLVGGLTLGLGGILGWQYYGQHQAEQAATASVAYDGITSRIAAGELPAARDALTALQSSQPKSPYVTHARLAVAHALAEQGEWSGAASELEQVLADGSNAQLSALARLRLARAYWAQDQADRALDTLAEAAPESFAPLYAELRGDIAAAKDDAALARSAYTAALASEQDYIDRAEIERKLGSLPAEAP